MILYRGFELIKAIPGTASTGAVKTFYYGTGATAQTTREEWFTRTTLVTQTDIISMLDSDGYVPLSGRSTTFSAYDTVRVTAQISNISGASIKIREIAIGSGTTDLFTRDVINTTIPNKKTFGFTYKICFRPHDFNDTWVSA